MFKEQINHITGKREWVVNEDNFDVAQELARSRFADMILDFDRNDMFLAGLKTIIEEKKANAERVHVLDIGTGTGLLSLMAAREGADKVTALEVFAPMAECARKITKSSPWKDQIKVISTRSTDLSHLGEKPNVIVAEVFDTELIGEGALRTFKEALTNLVQPGCRVIPSTGNVWILPVESTFLRKFNDNPYSELFPFCPGNAAVFDLQLSRVEPHLFKPLSAPVLAFKFDFEDAEKIIYDELFVREVICTTTGEVNAFLMWWDIDMDRTNRHFINMAPTWCNDNFKWRDHWMQAVYFPPKNETVAQGEVIKITCSHDEFSMWFSTGNSVDFERPYCSCNFHSIFTRQTLYWHNKLVSDEEETMKFVYEICKNKVVVVLGEGSLLGTLIAKFAMETIIVESNQHCQSILKTYVKSKHYEDRVTILSTLAELTKKPDLVFAEPFYLSAMNPWQNLRFWHEIDEIRKCYGYDIPVYPQKAYLRAVCEKFYNLHTTACPVGTVNGFDLSYFDEISHKAREATDAIIDEHPLWEYAGEATSEIFDICCFDLTSSPTEVSTQKIVPIQNGTNGIPLWIDWDYGSFIKTTGVREHILGKDPKWNIGAKQGVYLISSDLLTKSEILMSVVYKSNSGEMIFQFL